LGAGLQTVPTKSFMESAVSNTCYAKRHTFKNRKAISAGFISRSRGEWSGSVTIA